MSKPNKAKPSELRLMIPAVLEFHVRSKSVRHADVVRFLVEGIEHDEDARAMIREFVEDLARTGLKEE